MPTPAHGHGYSDLNFLIPELISGVQFEKGPYFADQVISRQRAPRRSTTRTSSLARSRD
jgi:hypothetical protein